MSAYIVDPKTIQNVVTLAFGSTAENRTSGCENADAFGKRLMIMNDAAVCQRYNQTPEDPESFEFRWRVSFYDRFNLDDEKRKRLLVLLKSAECLAYQCNEGNVPKTFPEFAQLEKLINRTRSEIIGSLPEYRELPWE